MIAAAEMDQEDEPSTPTSEEFRIGVPNLTCPPPPRKPKSLPGPITMSITLHNNNNNNNNNGRKYFIPYSQLHAFFASNSS
ncbi:unnamed protein product [Citrullus colocynthis]|uniref:Uncharacterized protein n=1 Tax=Citrullus colocynthis TaxID=252529 RepID=A0ABP0XZN3_9ROSI